MEQIFLEWRDSLKPKQKKRTYEHFDESFDLENEQHFRIVQRSIRGILNHQFLPFIKFIKKDIRYRKGKGGIPERSLKERPIMYASHMDAHIYSFYTYGWSNKYESFLKENGIDSSVIAYRKIPDDDSSIKRNKNNIQFSKSVFQSIQDSGDSVVIVADITKFFDNLNHKVLKTQMCKVFGQSELLPDEYKVFRSLTDYRYFLKDGPRGDVKEKTRYRKLLNQIAKKIAKERCSTAQAIYECGREFIKSNKTSIGIPQGSPASGLLANIYLASFDSNFIKTFPELLYRRYSDDLIIVSPKDKIDSVFSYLQTELSSYRLSINPSKAFLTEFTEQSDGSFQCTGVRDGEGKPLGRKYLDYLGFEFDGKDVLLRGKTLQRAYKKGDKRIAKFYERQTKDNPREKHRLTDSHKPRGGKTYIEKATQAMQDIGSKIDSQHKKISKFVRRKRREARKLIDV